GADPGCQDVVTPVQ
nr:RecName: Full=Unknown protein 3 [Ephedra distachya]